MTSFDLIERILFRDGLMLIIDKPAGIPVHPGPKGGANLQDYFDALRFGLPRRPELAHRLDRDTSGCLVLGRHRKALRKLGDLFAAGRVEKVYWAIVIGNPPAPSGRIEIALSKRTNVRGWWMKADPTGQPSITDYRVLGLAHGRTWLELRPRTGRTHQIRVHCAELGCPILGDPIYRPTMQPDPRPPLHLHARNVLVPLYPKREPIAAIAEPPAHMHGALTACGWTASGAVVSA